jgi:hypothetical protein
MLWGSKADEALAAGALAAGLPLAAELALGEVPALEHALKIITMPVAAATARQDRRMCVLLLSATRLPKPGR